MLRSFIRDTLVQPGAAIGPYRLLRVLGEGGCGIVYLAEQSRPIRRQVALKVIKPGMDSQRVLARFEAEQQALARMEHPHVARVHDAGLTRGGRPYFVMEYVQGPPITDYCDEQKLTVEERLHLFLHVCEAVQHAHQKGIIHRDLKPSNILVTVEDQEAVPKVIDFGVVRAINEPLTERTLYTEQGQLVGTPEYMSPEQADAGNQDIDTRTDIYSLGVVLYELLAGVLPFDRKALREGGVERMREVIREEEPTTPSTRLSRTSLEESVPLAERRGMDVRTLCRRLRGDVDWITLKAMAKDRTQRYESVGELAADLRRHLGHEPVTAMRPSPAYRLRKFIRRNRAMVTGVAAVFAILAAGIVVSTVLALGQARARRVADHTRREAQRQAQIAQAVTDFLNDDLLSAVEPARAHGQVVTVREILDAAAQKIDGRLGTEPLVEAAVRHTLGNTYRSLGAFDQGQPHLERAVQLRAEQLGSGDPATLASANALCGLYARQGRYREAERLMIRVLEAGQEVLGEEHREVLMAMSNLAAVYVEQRRCAEGEPWLLQALNIRKRTLGEEHRETLISMANLAVLYFWQGRHPEAEQLDRRTLELRKRVLGAEHPETVESMSSLANMCVMLHQYEEAESLYLEALEVRRRILGEEHPDTAYSMYDLAVLYMRQRRYEESERLALQALELRKRLLGAEHPKTLMSMYQVGLVYFYQRRYPEAESWQRNTLELRKRLLGTERPETLESLSALANVYLAQCRYPQAEPLYLELLETRKRVQGDTQAGTIQALRDLVKLYDAWGKPDEAAKWRSQLPAGK